MPDISPIQTISLAVEHIAKKLSPVPFFHLLMGLVLMSAVCFQLTWQFMLSVQEYWLCTA